MGKKIWLVIPACNEGRRIHDVLLRARRYVPSIIVVDDGSTDDTGAQASSAGALVLRHVINLGKGAALKTGCDYAVLNGASCIIAMDGDGQHDSVEIPNFVSALRKADVALGYRKPNDCMPLVFRFGNAFINKFTMLLYKIDLRDTQCGFRAFTAKAYSKLRWQSTDYSMESEMIANIGKHHLRYVQIPIETIYGDTYKGTTVIDGIKIAINMLTWRLRK
ncbi:MAG: glycosyltransferase family 2 protein [Candidatus Woesearchaeota archaeon]